MRVADNLLVVSVLWLRRNPANLEVLVEGYESDRSERAWRSGFSARGRSGQELGLHWTCQLSEITRRTVTCIVKMLSP